MLCFLQTLEHYWRTYKEKKKDMKRKRAHPKIHGIEPDLNYLIPYVVVGNSNANIFVQPFIDPTAQLARNTQQTEHPTTTMELDSIAATQHDNTRDDPPLYDEPPTSNELPAYAHDLPPIYDDDDERRRPTFFFTSLRLRYQVGIPERISSLSQRYGYGPTASGFLGLPPPRVHTVAGCMATGGVCGHASSNRNIVFQHSERSMWLE
jgi:hypothetical protein